MSTSDTEDGALEPREIPRTGFPWLTFLAAFALTATAFVLVRKIQSAADAATVEDAMEQCDKAAAQLEQRVLSNGGIYTS